MASRSRRSSRSRPSAPSNRSWPYAAGVVALVVLFGAVALFTGDGGGDFSVVAPDALEGRALPQFEAGQADPAVGAEAPRATGAALLGDGSVTVPVPGEPTIVVFLAHWCPHCRAEVPRVQAWLSEGGLPGGVAIRAVATHNDESRPNYPPDIWLRGERWTVPTVIDDGRIAAAYGLPGFPYWVFVDGEGAVVARHSGELPIADLAAAAQRLAP